MYDYSDNESEMDSQEFDGGILIVTSDELDSLHSNNIFSMVDLEQITFDELCEIIGNKNAKTFKKQMNEKEYFLKASDGAVDKKRRFQKTKAA